MKTRIIILSLFILFSSFFVAKIIKAAGTGSDEIGCVNYCDGRATGCPSGYFCGNIGLEIPCNIQGSCQKKESSENQSATVITETTDCTKAGPCQGKNQNDDCTMTTGGNGTCGKVVGSNGDTGSCFCWTKSNNSSGTTATYDDYPSCANACGTSGTCQVSDDSGKYFCVKSSGSSSSSSAFEDYYSCADNCNSGKCDVSDIDGKYYCSASSVSSTPDCGNGFKVGDLCSSKGVMGKCNSKGYCDGSGSGSTGINNTNPNLDCSSGVCFPSSTSLPDPQGGVVYIIGNVLTWILSIFGFLAIIAFIISGIQYTLSAGDEKMIDIAKRNMTRSIVGVVVALAGVVIIYAIDKMLRGVSGF